MSEGVVSLCATCKFAEWDKTANGRRHPNGNGRCTFVFPDTPLPKWFSARAYGRDSKPIGTLREYMDSRHGVRYIGWREHHVMAPRPCATYEAQP